VTHEEKRITIPHVYSLFNALLLANAWLLFDHGDDTAAASVLVVTCGLALWQLILLLHARLSTRVHRIERSIRKPHFVQAGLQLCIYLYWGLYWVETRNYALFIVVQIVFAYLFEMLLSLSRRGVWPVGFGQLPIVFSINLFLWFKEEYFYLQLLLIAFTYLAKEFLTWNQDGKKQHIFNPSAFSLAIVSFVLLYTGSYDKFTTGVDLPESFELPPNFFEVIFLLGLVVQFLFATTPITFGSVLSNFSLFYIAKFILGGPTGPSPIDLTVFLAMTLLITDPSTSPKTAKGKFLFGATYGFAIFWGSIGLRYFHQPEFFNKILFIPVLNLMVPLFDRVTGDVHHASCISPSNWRKWLTNTSWTLLYVCLFVNIVSLLKWRETWLVNPRLLPVPVVSQELAQVALRKNYCRARFPDVYKPFGFRSEIARYTKLMTIYYPKTNE